MSEQIHTRTTGGYVAAVNTAKGCKNDQLRHGTLLLSYLYTQAGFSLGLVDLQLCRRDEAGQSNDQGVYYRVSCIML